MRSRTPVAVLTLGTIIALSGCAKQIQGSGDPSDQQIEAAAAAKVISTDEVLEWLPDQEFYSSSADWEPEASDPYEALCSGVNLSDVETFGDAESIRRHARDNGGSSDGLTGGSFEADDTTMIFADEEAASAFLDNAITATEGCERESVDSLNNGGTATFTSDPNDYDEGDWTGYSGHVTVERLFGDGTSGNGAEVDLLAQYGNVVVYSSWLSNDVDDVDEEFGNLEAKIGEFLSAISDGAQGG